VNILDENIPEDQRQLLESWRIRTRQIGSNIGRKGMKDNEILPLLLQSRNCTFFTRDQDFYERGLCHGRYCLACLAVDKDEVATFVRRLLQNPELDTNAKRMGLVIRASHIGLSVWRRDAKKEARLNW